MAAGVESWTNAYLAGNNSTYNALIERKFSPRVAAELTDLGTKLGFDVLKVEERSLESLAALGEKTQLAILRNFADTSFRGIQDVGSVLSTCVKVFRERFRQIPDADTIVISPLIGGPKPDKLKALLDRTNFEIEVSVGQRLYKKPGLTSEDSAKGTEVYIGRVPPDTYEDDLVPLLEAHGPLLEVRVMMNAVTGRNKNFAFAVFETKADAQKAAKKLNDFEISRGRRLVCNLSFAGHRLYIGNIPKNKSKEELLEEFNSLTENLTELIVYSAPEDTEKKRNRGFCFLEFKDHKNAAAAKKALTRKRPFQRDVVVDWAETQSEPDEETMSKVKILFVNKLKAEATEEKLKEEFEKYGRVERIKRQNYYAFVHFDTRENAEKAMAALQGHVFFEVPCEIEFAKPQGQIRESRRRQQERNMMRTGFGDVMGYGAPPSSRAMVGAAMMRAQEAAATQGIGVYQDMMMPMMGNVNPLQQMQYQQFQHQQQNPWGMMSGAFDDFGFGGTATYGAYGGIVGPTTWSQGKGGQLMRAMSGGRYKGRRGGGRGGGDGTPAFMQ